MKNFVYSLVLFMGFILGLSSCEMDEPMFKEVSSLKGDASRDTVVVERVIVKDSTVYVYVADTTLVYDTIVVNNHDTVLVSEEIIFDCYKFNKDGNIVAVSLDKEYTASYNVVLKTSEDEVFFTQETKEKFVLVNNTSSFDDNNQAKFSVKKGNEEMLLKVWVTGAHSVIVNNQEIFPCEDFEIKAALTTLPDEIIDGKGYQVAVINYSFLNGDGETVARAQQYLYAPVTEPENERKVTIEYNIEDEILVINGLIDNSIFDDTTAVVRIPLSLTIACEETKVVYGGNFNFSLGANPSEVRKNNLNNMENENNSLVVTYNEVEALYSQDVTASGNRLTLNQSVRYYNNFVVTFGGERREFSYPVSVNAVSTVKKPVESLGSEAIQNIEVKYQATYASLTDEDVQGIQIIIEAIDFDGTILYANRSVTFDAIQSPRVYDCVLTDAYKYYYREIVGGIASEWEEKGLSTSEYNFILDGMKADNSALAIYFHKNVDGPKVGYLWDYLSWSTNKQVIYFSYNCPDATVDHVNFTMFGNLEDSILGKGVTEGALVKMVCEAGIYNGNTISPAETVYFVK